MTKKSLFLLAWLAASSAMAQSPIPGGVQLGDGDWVPCDHPRAIAAGLGCGAARPGERSQPPTCVTIKGVSACDLKACKGVDPYRESSRATACALLSQLLAGKTWALPSFAPGRTYVGAYPSERMRVLSVQATSKGELAVTCEQLPGGEVFAFLASELLEAGRWREEGR